MALVGAVCLGLAAGSRAEDDRAVYDAYTRQAEDHPRALVERLERERAHPSTPRQRTLLALGISRAQGLLENKVEQVAALERARRELAATEGDTRRLQQWLALEDLNVALNQETQAQIDARLARLRRDIRSDVDPMMACERVSAELWILIDRSSLDEAWVAAEELESCARQSGPAYLRAVALASMGQISGLMSSQPAATQRAAEYLESALSALGPQPPRFRRSLVEFDLAKAFQRAGQGEAAAAHAKAALQLSRDIDDQAGIGAALTVLAQIHLDARHPEQALPLVNEAQAILEKTDDGPRLLRLAELRILALTQLRRGELLAEIERARTVDRDTLQPTLRAGLSRAIADGLASVGRWPQAYAELQRARSLEALARDAARDSQVLRLQARYDDIRRNAEISELRHRNEAAALALKAEQAGRRTLWIALLLTAIVLAAAAVQAWRLARRRRVMADLALKDELTGCPNRRAVAAYGRAQQVQMHRLGLPFTVAMIDLDRFKQVNDQHGHDTGDLLLRAFARAAGQVLRGQDRFGRWGGEEWLLVMPGTPLSEMPRVFERLRQSFALATVDGLPSPHGQTFSMGAAQASDGPSGSSFDDLVREADRRLYKAKLAGRDRFELDP